MNSVNAYLVGGAVRDKLLGFEAKDKDWVVVGRTPQEMTDLGFKQVGADFPVFLHPDTNEEYALARTERKKGHGYQGFICDSSPSITLEEDLLRRDLTINAMAMSHQGELIDPYNGHTDLKNKVLRHVSSAFSEDPLRVLRVARFYARLKPLGFTIADETLTLLEQISQSGELEHLVAERVWQETHRALSEESPCAYFEALRQTSALKVLFPELDTLFGIPQPEQHHPEIDTGIHTMMALEQATQMSEETDIRYATLVHDLGKGLTDKEILPHHYGHEVAGLKPVKKLGKRLKVPKAFQELSLLVCEFHTHVHRAFELKPQTILKVLKRCDAFRRSDRFEKILVCCKADARGRTGFENEPYHQASYFLEALSAAKRINIMAIKNTGMEGKQLGLAIDDARVNAIKGVKESFNHDK